MLYGSTLEGFGFLSPLDLLARRPLPRPLPILNLNPISSSLRNLVKNCSVLSPPSCPEWKSLYFLRCDVTHRPNDLKSPSDLTGTSQFPWIDLYRSNSAKRLSHSFVLRHEMNTDTERFVPFFLGEACSPMVLNSYIFSSISIRELGRAAFASPCASRSRY